MTVLRSVVYAIFCLSHQSSKIYIGETGKTAMMRFQQHVWSSNTEPDPTPLHKAMKQIGVDNFYIFLLEHVTCMDSSEVTLRELRRERESYWVQLMQTHQPLGYNVTACEDA